MSDGTGTSGAGEEIVKKLSPRLIGIAFIILVATFVIFAGLTILAIIQNRVITIAGLQFGDVTESPVASDALPNGIIIMSERECAALGENWVIFEEAGGRVPVAEGTTTDAMGQTRSFNTGSNDDVGTFENVLLETHLPPHSHDATVADTTGNANVARAANGGNGYISLSFSIDDRANLGAQLQPVQAHSHTVRVDGGAALQGQAINNLPPHIVLNFCQLRLTQ